MSLNVFNLKAEIRAEIFSQLTYKISGEIAEQFHSADGGNCGGAGATNSVGATADE